MEMIKEPKTLFSSVMAAIAVIAMSCGSESSNRVSTQTVNARDFAFEPREITVKVGTTVHWQLAPGAMEHNVSTGIGCEHAIENGEDMDADLEPGDATSFDYTFTRAGDVPYYCEYHCQSNNMTGIVHVIQ